MVYSVILTTAKFVAEYKEKIIEPTKEMEFIRNKTIYEITTRLNALTMNTVVSGFMEYTNKIIEVELQVALIWKH